MNDEIIEKIDDYTNLLEKATKDLKAAETVEEKQCSFMFFKLIETMASRTILDELKKELETKEKTDE